MWDALDEEESAQLTDSGAQVKLGTTSDNFMAMWVEEDGRLQFTVCLSPELEHVGKAFEELLRKEEYGPVLNVLKLPMLDVEEEAES